MQTVITAADAADFLALVPSLAGYRPTDSVALVLFRGTRTAGVMRFDIAAFAGPEAERAAATAIGMACRVDRVDGIAVVVYTDAAYRDRASDAVAGRQIVDALDVRADACGLRLVDALCVAGDAWGSYLDPTTPRAGRDLALLAGREGDIPLPAPRGDHHTGACLPPRDLAERERVGIALRALDRVTRLLWGGRTERGDGAEAALPDRPAGGEPAEDDAAEDGTDDAARLDPRALAAAAVLDDVPMLFEDVLRRGGGHGAASCPQELEPFEAAALIWCLSRPALRDIALVLIGADIDTADRAAQAQLRWESGEEYPEDVAEMMWGDGPAPSPERLHAGLQLARMLAAIAPRPHRPGPLASAAWLSWAVGLSTHAAWYAEEAMKIEPEHGLARIVMTMVGAGHLPAWVFDRR
ncbi:DUF4192 domain-containing protein [Microbacterium sp. LRZ72]|uniref:DUF4192 family protein n=1 Tax=Microbacterium sp. LRZ72 TaxID=2942481 RepID=UPI0029A5719B|nr:DUF4192 family protein [Microbacterium sp. LRZ72]MDX2377812.1 DUF4192 domain-containing protein [Microbacterium sp. LRZ72]